jgi:selenocysteine-specific elongation factor
VIGTAGHIDHGKTSLVRALTGDDLDQLPEERARGITIALGFTHLRLPDGREAAFVDVPGHERLVRTMIAGATGLDAALLCVSAVDGVMPQTREHLAILDLLGLQAGVVALTMSDLVDEETLELAQLDVEELVEGTFLEGAPIVPTVAGDSLRGIGDLVAALSDLPAVARGADGPLRLPIDRAFVRQGFGTVITGTLRSGALSDGDEVVILPEGTRARVRGLQVHGQAVEVAEPGQRTAANLAGVERDDLARGCVVAHPDTLAPASILDATLHTLPDAPALAQGARVRLLAGTAEVMAVLSVLSADGAIDPDQLEPDAHHRVQLRTEAPIVVLPGDRIIVRRESPVSTLGGGRVLDPWAPRARRRDHARIDAEVAALEAGDTGVLLRRAGDAGLSPAEAQLRRVTDGVLLGERLLDPTRVAALELGLLSALDAFHAERPLAPGAPRRELHRPPVGHLPQRADDALLDRLVASGAVALDGPRMRRPDFAVRLTDDQRSRSEALEAELRAAGLEGPKASDLLAREPELTHLHLESGRFVRVADKLLHGARLEALVASVRAWFLDHDALSATDFKALTGLSRKHAIPLLEWLDAQRVTARHGDSRRLRAP